MVDRGPHRACSSANRKSPPPREWRAADAAIGNRLADWTLEEHGIEVALHNASRKEAGLFTFEGQSYSRETHVKVDDFKDPSRCGRIYFAVDSVGRRSIVDDVGLHL
jgi:hypothetical protein